MISEELGKEIASVARVWVKNKVPYRHRGVSDRGCDCTGFLIGVMRSLGFIKNYQLRYYPLDWNMHAAAGEYLLQELSKVAVEIPKQETRAGDVLVFKFARCESHAGIYIQRAIFAHSYLTAKRVKFGCLVNSNWGKRWTKTFRWDETKIKN